jgi:hypothetical protein
MPTILKTKNSVVTTVVPTTLQQGELAVNITDKKMWVGNAATTPVQLLGDGGSGSFTTVNTTNLEVTNIKAKDGTASASIANSTGIFTHSTATVFTAGTVSAPSITTTGDTNTGIFFPAADSIAFTEGGSESMRIDSSGNVGIGTSSPAARLDVVGAGGGGTQMVVSDGANQGRLQLSKSAAFYGFNAGADYGGIQFFSNGTEHMRIGTTSRVSIGTTVQVARLTVQNMSTTDSATIDLRGNRNFSPATFGATSVIAFSDGTRNAHDFGAIRFEQNPATSDGGGALVRLYSGGASSSFAANCEFLRGEALGNTNGVDNIQFRTAGSERMRIDLNGNVLVGTTTYNDGVTGILNSANGRLYATASSAASLNLNRLTSTGEVAIFKYASTPIAAINITSNGATYTGTNGITFTATQTASADANTLDDYEEGDWTPNVQINNSSTGITYTVRNGKYVKIGKTVYLGFLFVLSSKGASSGNVTITDLPFSCGNGASSQRYSGACGYYDNLTSAGMPVLLMEQNSNTCTVRFATATVAQAMTNTQIGNTTAMHGLIVYETA